MHSNSHRWGLHSQHLCSGCVMLCHVHHTLLQCTPSVPHILLTVITALLTTLYTTPVDYLSLVDMISSCCSSDKSMSELCSVMAVRLVSAAELHFNAFVARGKPMPVVVSIVWSIQMCTVAVIVPPSIREYLSTVGTASVIVPVMC